MEGHRGPPTQSLRRQRRPRLTEGRLVCQRLAIEVGPVGHEQLHQVHLRAVEPGLLKGPEPGARTPRTPAAKSATPAGQPRGTHLAPVGCGVQRLPAVLVLGAQTGLVLQQQDGCLAEPAGGRDVELRAKSWALSPLPDPSGSHCPPASPRTAGPSPAWPRGPGGRRHRRPPAAGSGCLLACIAPAGPGPPRCCPG